MVKVSSEKFIVYLLFFFAGFLWLYPKHHIEPLSIQLPLTTQKSKAVYPRTFLLNPQTLAANKKRIEAKDPALMSAYNNLIKQADRLLTQKPVSVMDKSQTPPSGSKHDYMSMAPYLWPDPSKPNGMPYIAKDGEVNPEVNTIPDRNNLNTMISTVKTLSLAYYFSNNQKYADHAILLLRTWFINPKTRMNPNLNFAQGRKGVNSGGAGGIIDTYALPEVIDAIGILEGANSSNSNDKNSLKEWFTDYLNWLLTSKDGKLERQQPNNHGTWYDVQVSSIALYLGNNQLAKQTIENDMKNRIPKQISQEGEQPLELYRTKSWDYSTYNLLALCNLADIAGKIDINLWHYRTFDGRGIKKAVDFLIPYATDNKVWKYNQIVTLDKKELIAPLFQAATGFNKLQYWNTSLNILGKSADTSEYQLINQIPTSY